MEISLSIESYDIFHGSFLGFVFVLDFFPQNIVKSRDQYCACKSTDETGLPLV